MRETARQTDELTERKIYPHGYKPGAGYVTFGGSYAF